MVRPKVGCKYQNKIDKSLVIEIVESNKSGDWIVKARWPDGRVETLNAGSLGHHWLKLV